MKIKTSELTGAALDWAVAKCQEVGAGLSAGYWTGAVARGNFNPSTDWSQGGPIIEREKICVKQWPDHDGMMCHAQVGYDSFKGVYAFFGNGDTPLIAAMRCYVACKLGDEVEIPESLYDGQI